MPKDQRACCTGTPNCMRHSANASQPLQAVGKHHKGACKPCQSCMERSQSLEVLIPSVAQTLNIPESAQLRITSTVSTLSTRDIRVSGNISPDLEGVSSQKSKKKQNLLLKAAKQVTVPPGIFHHLFPPATSSSIHFHCWYFTVCSAPSNWVHSPHRKRDKRWSRLTSRRKVHPEEPNVFSTKVLFLLAFCLLRCFTELKRLGASDQNRSSFRGGGLPSDSSLPLLVRPTTSHELVSVKEAVCARCSDLAEAPWLLLQCKSTNMQCKSTPAAFGENI